MGRRRVHDGERDLIRALWREHLAVVERRLKVDHQLLVLMGEREALNEEAKLTDLKAIASKFEISKTQVLYAVRPRSTTHV